MSGLNARMPADSQFDLVVLGDCNPDLVLTGDEIVPSFGQVERFVDAADLMIGGSGSIVACGAARLGLRTALVGMVGDDLFGNFMCDALTQRGVDTSSIVVEPSLRTGVTVILSRPGDRAILTFPGTIAAFAAADVDGKLLTTARHVHVASYFLQTSLAPSLPTLFERAHQAGATTSVDPNWDPQERWDSGIRELLGLVDVFLPNGEEAIRIGGVQDAPDAARALAAHGPLTAVKLGAAGSARRRKRRAQRANPRPGRSRAGRCGRGRRLVRCWFPHGPSERLDHRAGAVARLCLRRPLHPSGRRNERPADAGRGA